MEKLKLRIFPDSVLRSKCAEIRSIGEPERRIVSEMIDIMRKANGVGLAGPQVGIERQIIVIEDVERNMKGRAMAFFNPKIIKKKGRCSFCEGCLSIPGVTADVVRPEHILMEAIDIEGRPVTIDTGGILARILQHEIDHLNGILFIDRINFLKRRKVLREISSRSKVCMEL